MTGMPQPIVLCVLDGMGERSEREGNAVKLASTPVLDRLRSKHPSTRLTASGSPVGLAEGGRGSGAHGHLVLGAGRPVPTARPRIDQAIAKRKLGTNDMIDQTMRICVYDKCPLHLIGLLSDDATHSSTKHLFELMDIAEFHEIPVVVHAILDGRTGPKRSAMRLLDKLDLMMDGREAILGTLSGRYWSMDRDQQWDRTYQAFHAIVRDKVLGPAAPRAETAFDAVSAAYGNDIDDEYLHPIRIGDYGGLNGDFMCDFSTPGAPWEWTGEDAGIAFNFRGDRLRQLTAMLACQDLPSEVTDDLVMDRQYPVRAFREHCLATLTNYSHTLSVPVAYEPEPVGDTFGELLEKAGLTQLRIAESEKASHVGSCFSGRRHAPFEGEQQRLLPSPRLVDRWHEQPNLSAEKVAAAAVEAIASGEHAFILVNVANADVLGHEGDLQAAIDGVGAVDRAVGAMVDAIDANGGTLLITGSHGNSELMEADGKPHTGHTDNPVPFIWVGGSGTLRDSGSLADVAPTMLEMLGLDQPEAMTGRSLRATANDDG